MSLHLHLDRLRLGSPLLRHVFVGHGRLSDLSHLCHHPWRHIPSPPLPPPPSSLHLPPPVPTSLPLPSSPLPPLPVLLFIPPLVDHREDIPEVELPPRKRLYPTAPTSRYEVGESLTAAPRPTGGHRADYGFISTMNAEIRCRRAEEVGYGIRDVWVDPTEAVEERVDGLVEDRQLHYKTARLLDQEALVSREAWAHSVGLSSAVHYELQAYRTHTQMQDYRIASQESLMKTMIAQVSSLQGQLSAALGQIQALQARDRTHVDDLEGADTESFATARAAAATAARAAAAITATPITAAAVEQLIKARVSAALANHETIRNNTNGHGDGSHNYKTGIRGTVCTPCECTYKDFLNCKPFTFKGTEGVVVLSQWFKKMESVFHISNCAVENQALKKMMTVKYCPRGEIKKLEIKLWNLKVKGTDVASYTLCFQKLALMCGRMFHEESEEVEKYVGGLPDMIRGNGHQQQNKRQNTRRAYTAGPGEKREYMGSLPFCTKCNYHHKGPCAPRCNKCKKIGHLAHDCRSSGPNGALQERLPEAEEWKPW
ncbi:putative reverse transcriptase domain-containing protein [Tanacetum coccineum]